MSSTISTNMSLVIPGVGTEAGPTYAEDINVSLTLIDQHTHAPGSGVPITPAAISINTALSFASNFATNVAGVTLIAQNSTPAINTVYESGVDLYYVDGNGNNVRLTQSGNVAGSTGSISGLSSPASATYVSGSATFVWQSGASIAANLDCAAVLMRNISPNSTYALTLQPPAALSANYSLTLPALPASQKIMTLDSSGNITAPYTVDGSTLNILSNVISVKSAGITATYLASNSVTTAKIADGNVTNAKLAALTEQVSSSSGSYNAGPTPGDVTNLIFNFTGSGRPVFVGIIADGSGGESAIEIVGPGGDVTASATVSILRDSSIISSTVVKSSGSGTTGMVIPPSAFFTRDNPGSSTVQYKVQANYNVGSMQIRNVKLWVYEL